MQRTGGAVRRTRDFSKKLITFILFVEAPRQGNSAPLIEHGVLVSRDARASIGTQKARSVR